LLPRIASILTENDPELKEYDFKDPSDVLREYQLLRSPQKILFNGNLTLVNPKAGQSINMGIFQPFIGVSSQTALEWEIKEIGFDKIITIENEASFYEFCQMNQDKPGLGNYLVVFLKGFSNRLRRQFLLKVNMFAKQANKTVSFFHWGDLDAGGIEIFLNLRQSTGIDIRPFLFRSDVIEYHKSSCKPLEKLDSMRLSRIRGRLDSFITEDHKMIESLIDKMLELNLKLEQEAIDIQNWVEFSYAKPSAPTYNPRIDG
jgi:DNA topoisomerase VI subunit A